MACGVIYLVPVPIGNLGDITLRALDSLRSASLIACEDTRKTAFLLNHFQIPIPRLISFHKFNEKQREELLIRHLEEGNDLVVVSDAGSPGISDPSGKLVESATNKGIRVIALPGATAFVPAITASGMDSTQFQFIGFLPQTRQKRLAKLTEIASYPYPSVLYEAPHRLKGTLIDIRDACGKRKIFIAREISKLYEEHLCGYAEELLENPDLVLRGEFVLIIEGKPPLEKKDTPAQTIEDLITVLTAEGLKSKEICLELSQSYGLSHSEAYELVLKYKQARQ